MSKGLSGQSVGTGPEASAHNPLALPAALDRLRSRLVPFELRFFEEVGSTSDAAARLLAAGTLRPPALVVTSHQTAGRGQRGKSWFSSPASLAVSFVVPVEVERPVHQLPLLVGLTVREALEGVVGRESRTASSRSPLIQRAPSDAAVKVKWPNDLVVQGRKLAGILSERKHGADIIGVGANIRHDPGAVPPELQESIIALSDFCDDINRWEVLAALSEALRDRILETPHEASWQWVLGSWREHDALLGRQVEVSTPHGVMTGVADGMDENGRLRIVASAGEMVSIASGTVRLVATPRV